MIQSDLEDVEQIRARIRRMTLMNGAGDIRSDPETYATAPARRRRVLLQ